MDAEYRCEPMTIDDYDDVVALWRASEGMSKLESRDELARYLERNPGISQVVRWRGELIAAVLAGHDGRRGYLYHLAVAAAHRHRGIARAIVDECLARLSALGLPRCGLQVYRDNTLGLDFWRRAGWDERADVQPFTKDLP